MPPLPFPTFVEPVAEAVIRFESQTSPQFDAVNVMHFLAADELGDLEPVDLEELGDALHRWVSGAAPYTGGYNDVWSAEYKVNDIAIKSEQTGAEFEVTRTFGATGQLAGDLLPREVALVASLRTGMTGRSRRGRIFVPGQTESVNTNGACTSAHALAVGDQVQALIDELPGDTAGPAWTLVIASHTNGFITPVTAVVVNTEWDTMRSRGGG